MKLKNKKVVYGILFSACSLLSALIATQQPATKKHSWFTELAGDWAILIGDTDYIIGNSFDPNFPNAYYIGVPSSVQLRNGKTVYHNKLLVDGINTYLFFDPWILAEGDNGWCLIDTRSDEYIEAPSVQKLQNIANVDVSGQAINMIAPRPSYRNKLFLFAIALMFPAIILFASQIPLGKLNRADTRSATS